MDEQQPNKKNKTSDKPNLQTNDSPGAKNAATQSEAAEVQHFARRKPQTWQLLRRTILGFRVLVHVYGPSRRTTDETGRFIYTVKKWRSVPAHALHKSTLASPIVFSREQAIVTRTCGSCSCILVLNKPQHNNNHQRNPHVMQFRRDEPILILYWFILFRSRRPVQKRGISEEASNLGTRGRRG